jgi:hypothetical protein
VMATDYSAQLCYDSMSATRVLVVYIAVDGTSKAVLVELEAAGTSVATMHTNLAITGPCCVSNNGYGICVALSSNVMVFGGQNRYVRHVYRFHM